MLKISSPSHKPTPTSQCGTVSAAPALVAGIVVRVDAWAGVCDHDHQRGVVVVADTGAVKPLAITVGEVHGLALDLLALAVGGAPRTQHSSGEAVMVSHPARLLL
eukprot:GHRQ01040101.1.p1 GENE.GHRQ01040101.1~~GHRQ01040101.1.p1  ORF type:complete len:105 (-),score=1.83 GHRQ01040101.1:405-719(-)